MIFITKRLRSLDYVADYTPNFFICQLHRFAEASKRNTLKSHSAKFISAETEFYIIIFCSFVIFQNFFSILKGN